jgi:hypothetical protein
MPNRPRAAEVLPRQRVAASALRLPITRAAPRWPLTRHDCWSPWAAVETRETTQTNLPAVARPLSPLCHPHGRGIFLRARTVCLFFFSLYSSSLSRSEIPQETTETFLGDVKPQHVPPPWRSAAERRLRRQAAAAGIGARRLRWYRSCSCRGGRTMACTITSLFLFAMFGVVVAGTALLSSAKEKPPARRQETTTTPSGDHVIA